MKVKLIAAVMLISLSRDMQAQNVSCGQAVSQLQSYAAQVNQLYQNEYWQVIPNIRCPLYNNIGQPVHPQIVQNCRLQMLGYLNQWYGQQCIYVNNTYAQIARACSVNEPTSIRKPAPRPNPGNGESAEIDTNEIEELTAGIDEDKAMRISIPKTASGYRPRN